ncbi:hypothetical protein [Actinophytocola sp.]|uniref:hypothetical protein n=1 Tax=Actinophytocola sp. TaxID=1872138 RepID=UPI0025C0C226|nr:hypothetical protein [Actinophytocola sp.]
MDSVSNQGLGGGGAAAGSAAGEVVGRRWRMVSTPAVRAAVRSVSVRPAECS